MENEPYPDSGEFEVIVLSMEVALKTTDRLKSFSDAVLSQEPSPKNFLQKFLSLILTNLDQIHRDFLRNPEKKKLQKI